MPRKTAPKQAHQHFGAARGGHHVKHKLLRYQRLNPALAAVSPSHPHSGQHGGSSPPTNVNLRSAFLVTSAVLPEMRRKQWGRLIFISSVTANIGGVVGPHYAASKAGMIGLMHGYASQLARKGSPPMSILLPWWRRTWFRATYEPSLN